MYGRLIYAEVMVKTKANFRYALRITLIFCSFNRTKLYANHLHAVTGRVTAIKVQKTERF